MKLTFASLLIASSLFLVIGCTKEVKPPIDGSLPHTKKYSAEVANNWFHLLSELSRSQPYIPPQTIRLFAYSGLALYESVVPGMPSYRSAYSYLTRNEIPHDKKKDYHWPAAANAAIARIASRIVGNFSTSPNLAPIQQLEASLNSKYAGETTPEQLQRSVDFGRLVADRIYEYSATDGTLNSDGSIFFCPTYIPLGGPGNWVPTPPLFFEAAGACQGQLRTFIPKVAQLTRPPAPPVYSTHPGSEFYEMANQIYELSLNRSQEDSLIGEAWRDSFGNFNTPAHVIRLTVHILDKENIDLEQASLIYSQQGISMFDVVAANFNAKFYYSLLRPVTYIRDVIGQPGWNSLYPAPQHPSYPAVAPAAAAAGIRILEKRFGNNYSFIDSTQQNKYGAWSYSSLQKLVEDVGRSRTHSGLNFRLSVIEGIKQGRTIGDMTSNFIFKR